MPEAWLQRLNRILQRPLCTYTWQWLIYTIVGDNNHKDMSWFTWVWCANNNAGNVWQWGDEQSVWILVWRQGQLTVVKSLGRYASLLWILSHVKISQSLSGVYLSQIPPFNFPQCPLQINQVLELCLFPQPTTPFLRSCCTLVRTSVDNEARTTPGLLVMLVGAQWPSKTRQHYNDTISIYHNNKAATDNMLIGSCGWMRHCLLDYWAATKYL